MRLEDLPESMQRQVREKAGIREPRKKDRTGAGRTTTDGVCWGCGERFTSTTAWEKHSDATGHRRFELVADLKEVVA
jgi:hypothetical protein